MGTFFFGMMYNKWNRKWCRAYVAINFTYWIKCCSHTPCILGSSTEGTVWKCDEGLNLQSHPKGREPCILEWALYSSMPLLGYDIVINVSRWIIYNKLCVNAVLQFVYEQNLFSTGICRVGYLHGQWDFKCTLSCLWCRHLVCINVSRITGRHHSLISIFKT